MSVIVDASSRADSSSLLEVAGDRDLDHREVVERAGQHVDLGGTVGQVSISRLIASCTFCSAVAMLVP